MAVLVAEQDGGLCGFVELSIRPYAEGSQTHHIGYVEGVYVEPKHRRRGFARALITAAEDWARSSGCREMASDTVLKDSASVSLHKTLRFEEVASIRCFRKDL